MNDQLYTLSKLFSERIFRIPDYQRGYAWGTKEITEFWNDLCRIKENHNHYFGVLTLEPVPSQESSNWIDDLWLINSKQYCPFYVVDGQQRLTTSIILLAAIIDTIHEKAISSLNYTTEDEIIKKFLYEKMDCNRSVSYLFAYQPNNPSYVHWINKILDQKSEISIVDEETLYTKNLDNAKQYLKEKIKDLPLTDLEIIYKKITQHFLLNIYVITADIDVFVAFETMNNRGKPLSHLELLKNRLIYLSSLLENDNDIKERLRRNINECWKDIYHYLGKNRSGTLLDDAFLNSHFELYFIDEIINRDCNDLSYLLDKHFVPDRISEKTLDSHMIFDYVESLKSTIKIWNWVNNPSYSEFSEDINEYLFKIYYLTTGFSRRYMIDSPIPYYYEAILSPYRLILMAFLEKGYNNSLLLKLLKNLERYIFLRLIYERNFVSDDISDKVFVGDALEIISQIRHGSLSIDQFIHLMERCNSSLLASAETNKNLVSYHNRVGNVRPFLKYFLCEYELFLMKQSRTSIEKIDRDLFFRDGYNSIEHILPQNSHHPYWTSKLSSYSQKQRTQLKESLGNLVAISKNKNGKLANKPFPEKKSNAENALGYRYGTYSENELMNYDDWGPIEILKRGLKMVSFLEQRWDLKIGNKSEKIKFLGLEFLDIYSIKKNT